jgi:hypothetical protein
VQTVFDFVHLFSLSCSAKYDREFDSVPHPASDREQLVAFRCGLRVGEVSQKTPWVDATVLAVGERQVQGITTNEFDPLNCQARRDVRLPTVDPGAKRVRRATGTSKRLRVQRVFPSVAPNEAQSTSIPRKRDLLRGPKWGSGLRIFIHRQRVANYGRICEQLIAAE